MVSRLATVTLMVRIAVLGRLTVVAVVVISGHLGLSRTMLIVTGAPGTGEYTGRKTKEP